MATLSYTLTFADVPFVGDHASPFRMYQPGTPEQEVASTQPLRQQQPRDTLRDEIERIQPTHQLRDFGPPFLFLGRNLSALAQETGTNPTPTPDVRVGEWFYPTGAVRWSVFRGLATSAQVKAMLAATRGNLPKTFVMKAAPIAPDDLAAANYVVSTSMYMLPPRPVAEHGTGLDGLYVVTLVDGRYYFQGTPASLRVKQGTTWTSLLTQLADALGITLTYSAIASVYGQPEPDSQLWTNAENAAVLLDAVAYNVGRVVVRKLDGTFALYTPAEAAAIAYANRGSASAVVRTAGGDLFTSGTRLPVGNLTLARNAVLPATIRVTYPKYVAGDDPVPHYANTRYANQRASVWYEDSYGDALAINVPIASGGAIVSGMSGVGDLTIRDTAKALYGAETDLAGNPLNNSGLVALTTQIAQDYFANQTLVAFDETYPGTFAWAPDGIHDIVWTYAESLGQGTTRVTRTEWNQAVRDLQHAGPPVSGTIVVRGVGGPSVAQTWRDSFSGTVDTTLAAQLQSGDYTASFTSIANFPTQNRWRGKIEDELVLFEGTSGGTTVGVAYRGIDGTVQTAHAAGTTVTQVVPDTAYGINLVTIEKGQFAYPSDWTSGGVQGVNLVPQTQTVLVLSASGVPAGDFTLYSGRLHLYDTTTDAYAERETVWIVERNDAAVTSGYYYDGQFVGFSAMDVVSPLYLVNAFPTSGGAADGDCCLCASGYATICVSGYPNPLISGPDYHVVSGYPYPLVSGPRVVVSGCFPYPLHSGVYYPTIVPSGNPVYPYPLPVPSGVASGYYGLIPPPPSGGPPWYPYPLPVPSGTLTTSAPYGLITPGPKVPWYPYPLPVPSGTLTTSAPYGLPQPPPSGLLPPPMYPLPVPSGTLTTSAPYGMVQPPASGTVYPYPLFVPWGTPITSAPYGMVQPPPQRGSGLYWPYPLPVPPGTAPTSAPYTMLAVPLSGTPQYPYPLPLPAGIPTTSAPYGLPTPLDGGNFIWPYPLPVPQGSDPLGHYQLTSGYPYPLKSGPLLAVSGYDYPLKSGVYLTVSGPFPYPLKSGLLLNSIWTPFPWLSGREPSTIYKNSGLVGVGPALNFIDGSGVTIVATDGSGIIGLGFAAAAAASANSGHCRLPGSSINVASGSSAYADWDYLNPEYDVGGYAASGGFIVPTDKSGYHTLGAYGTTGDATEGAETGNVIMFIVVNDMTVIAGQSTGARDPNIPINTEHLCAHTNYGLEGGDKVAVQVTNNQDDTIQFSPQAFWISRLP